MISSMENGHPNSVAWFCVRSHLKHEHITAAYLREDLGIEVYLPRVRFRLNTRTGPKWRTEALFPNYLFARFNLSECFRRVHHAQGARGIVHFGNHWPAIPDSLIAELRRTIQDDRPYVLPQDLQLGDTVVISGGPLHNLEAVVTRIMPGKMRAAVLIEFLGRPTAVEVETEVLLRAGGEQGPRKL